MDNQKFGKFIKELRKKSNMTQKELGEKLNVTDKTISIHHFTASWLDDQIKKEMEYQRKMKNIFA